MHSHPPKQLHFWLSIFLFAISFASPAFYTGSAHDPQSGYALLLWGWLGPVDRHFAWFANPLYLLAIANVGRPQRSFALASISLLFALSFFLNGKIIVGASHASINSYGWGYYLWVLSMGIFAIGQFISCLNVRFHLQAKVIATSLVLLLSYIPFHYHYYSREESHAKLQHKRTAIFEKECKIAKEEIYQQLDLRNSGIFVESGSGQSYSKKGKTWKTTVSGRLAVQAFDKNLLAFYETKNEYYPAIDEEYIPYKKFLVKGSRGIPTEELESHYKFSLKRINYPRELGIWGEEATIIEISTGRLIAKSRYIFDKNNGKLCGQSDENYFSFSRFLARVLAHE